MSNHNPNRNTDRLLFMSAVALGLALACTGISPVTWILGWFGVHP